VQFGNCVRGGEPLGMTAVASSHGDPSDVSTPETSTVSPIRRPRGIKGFVYDYIMMRVDTSPEELEWILTSDVWYDLAKDPKVEDCYKVTHGFSMKSPQAAKQRIRETIQVKYIKDICDALGIRRADIKILAGDVGYLYFRGERYAISLDELDSLKLIGTDVLIIEKQGIAESLKDLAAPYGIALLSTRGFLTENAIDLAELAESSGANVSILTDYDISGHVIAYKVPSVPRIGIDFDTLDDLNISSKQLKELKQGEYYTPNEEHLRYAEDNMDLDEDTFEFLKDRRIEINAVKNVAGAEELWNWIISRIDEIYPNRNYNRAVRKPKPHWFRPRELDELNELVDKRLTRALGPEIIRCEVELSNYQGFIDDVSEYERDLYDEFEYVLNGGSSSSDTDVVTSEQSRTKNWLKSIQRDIKTLLIKYSGKQEGSR
jgi:hypothetical protein